MEITPNIFVHVSLKNIKFIKVFHKLLESDLKAKLQLLLKNLMKIILYRASRSIFFKLVPIIIK